ncbi:MAG: tetratricopeptide repeat protein, partial [cyanobacterium endosymbiont of Rhopalodia yunnanensis]
NDFTEAIKLKPDYGEAYFNRGLVLSDLGQSQKAIVDFKKAAQLWEQQGYDQGYYAAIEQIKALELKS